MKRLQLVCALFTALMVFQQNTVLSASLNDAAIIALDGNLASAGYQGVDFPNGIGPNSIVGFGIYVRNYSQLRAYSIDLSWTGDAVLVTSPQNGLVSGTSLSPVSVIVNGSLVTVAPESKLFTNELSIGELSDTGSYRKQFALAGGTAPASSEYTLLYVAVFNTSSSFGPSDKLDVTATVTLGDDTATEYVPGSQVFHVNEVVPRENHYTLDVENSGNTAIVLFPPEAVPMIDDIPIDSDDEIAVFTPRGECAGFSVWDDENCIITIWGDDPTDAGTAGFLAGETYQFRVWDASASKEYKLSVTCAEGDCIYNVNVITVIDSASYTTPVNTSIPLVKSWNMISADVNPENPAMDAVFSAIVNDVGIVKNGRGEVYWPEYGVNQIGDWNVTDGYQVRMIREATLQIIGEQVDAAGTGFELSAGWNLVSYIGAENVAPVNAFTKILNILDIVKNGSGDVYWPKHGIDQIGAMHRGSGYLIKVSDSLSGPVYRKLTEYHAAYFTPVPPSDNNATIMITAGIMPEVNNRMFTPGDEIGVFTPSGICIGAGTWSGDNLAVTVWGDDAQTEEQDGIRAGESYVFRIWDSDTMSECQASASYQIGSAEYTPNDIVVLETLVGDGMQTSVDSASPVQFELKQNRPNPFNPSTVIGFTIPVSGHVELTIYSALGEKIDVLVDDMLEPGMHEFEWYANQYASGVYFYRLNAAGFSDIGRMMLIK